MSSFQASTRRESMRRRSTDLSDLYGSPSGYDTDGSHFTGEGQPRRTHIRSVR